MELVATCLFGLEGLLGDEIDSLGYKRVSTIDGRVTFLGDASAVARCNLRLRTAERVLIKLGSFKAYSFDNLFEGTKKLPWKNYISKTDAFPVKGHSVRSKLYSIPDCQKIIKKAVVDSLSASYGIKQFDESGVKYQIEFFILNDEVTLMIDTSGAGLHKRGYREIAGIAPLRETLAAAMVKLSRMRDNVIICDPFCGSGTIAIEAALIATNRAPGLYRDFISEDFPFINKKIWESEREEAKSEITPPLTEIYGSDIDIGCVDLAKNNAKKALVSNCVKFYKADACAFNTPVKDARGTIITNPPYGERLGDLATARELAKGFGKAVGVSVPSWQLYVISSDPLYDKYFGRKCDKKRVLYNGMIKCDLYQFFKRQDTPFGTKTF